MGKIAQNFQALFFAYTLTNHHDFAKNRKREKLLLACIYFSSRLLVCWKAVCDIDLHKVWITLFLYNLLGTWINIRLHSIAYRVAFVFSFAVSVF
jgi:hypothetical protein